MKTPRALVLAALLFAPVAARAETPVPADRLAAALSLVARGQDPAFGPVAVPALSADPGLSAGARRARHPAAVAGDLARDFRLRVGRPRR